MIRKLKTGVARGLFLMVVATGLGFGVIAAAMAAVIGGLLMLGVRLAADAEAELQPRSEARPAPDTASDGAQPA
jgi:hypothetical protein